MADLESKRAQVARIRRTGVRALADYALDDLRLTFIAHGENTTFWQTGRMQANNPRPVHFRRLGGVLARLHEHASTWTPPSGFVRMQWEWETFFGNTMEYGGISAADCWDLLPTPVRLQFDEIARRMLVVMTDGPDGLIHADLHLENALFDGDALRIIDFDDCGFGSWLYDLAVPLWDNRYRDNYPVLRAALLDGYAAHRELPDLTHLDAFIATRDVAFGLWCAGMSQVNPSFAANLDMTMDYIHRSLTKLL